MPGWREGSAPGACFSIKTCGQVLKPCGLFRAEKGGPFPAPLIWCLPLFSGGLHGSGEGSAAHNITLRSPAPSPARRGRGALALPTREKRLLASSCRLPARFGERCRSATGAAIAGWQLRHPPARRCACRRSAVPPREDPRRSRAGRAAPSCPRGVRSAPGLTGAAAWACLCRAPSPGRGSVPPSDRAAAGSGYRGAGGVCGAVSHAALETPTRLGAPCRRRPCKR